MVYEQYMAMLKKSINRIQADFDFSADIYHNTSKGTFREDVIKKFLRPFLPNAYGLSGGQAFDKEGNISKQLDVVIYDALYSYIAPYSEDFIYFPCESIYGVIEIKSSLDRESFMAAADNIASVKKLKRDAIKEYMVNPIKPLHITNMNWKIDATNEYLGIIFAYTGTSAENVLGYLKNIIESESIEKDYLPNIIVLFDQKTIVTRLHRLKDDNDFLYSVHPLTTYDGFCCINYNEDFLAEFLLLLFVCLRSIELKAMNIVELEKTIMEEALKEYNKEVIPNIIFPCVNDSES